ncbi:MAG: polyprenyl synthetase family protein, partial [Lentisphaerae bacterium]|nr:polyprenyl synthetase family protein [Lentisphaerota bacterium]
MDSLNDYLIEKKQLIDQHLNELMPGNKTPPAIIHKAMRYSVFAGGKRVRPALCLEACKAVGGNKNDALTPAAALEIFHTYTHIHDDLPAMDNDDLRRGKLTSHKMFGEANAILAGDALLTMAFELLAGAKPKKPYAPHDLVLELAKAGGSRGVVGGQVEDMAAEHKPHSAKLMEYIHLHKTADLFKASVRIGAMCGGAKKSDLSKLSKYGVKLGLAFQAADDILDAISDTTTLGKATKKDESQGKMTCIRILGMKKSLAYLNRLRDET